MTSKEELERPTTAMPSTPEKIQVMAERYVVGLPLSMPGDKSDFSPEEPSGQPEEEDDEEPNDNEFFKQGSKKIVRKRARFQGRKKKYGRKKK